MARLKTATRRLKAAPTRLKTNMSVGSGGRSRLRDATAPYRAWYKTAKWQKLRLRILERDEYTCQRTGVLVLGKHPAPNAPVVDHIIPHRGNEDMFWDETNLQTVSKAYHDSVKQSEERFYL